MDELVNSLIIKPNELINLVDFYNSLPNECLIKDSIGLSINNMCYLIKNIKKRSK